MRKLIFTIILLSLIIAGITLSILFSVVFFSVLASLILISIVYRYIRRFRGKLKFKKKLYENRGF